MNKYYLRPCTSNCGPQENVSLERTPPLHQLSKLFVIFTFPFMGRINTWWPRLNPLEKGHKFQIHLVALKIATQHIFLLAKDDDYVAKLLCVCHSQRRWLTSTWQSVAQFRALPVGCWLLLSHNHSPQPCTLAATLVAWKYGIIGKNGNLYFFHVHFLRWRSGLDWTTQKGDFLLFGKLLADLAPQVLVPCPFWSGVFHEGSSNVSVVLFLESLEQWR